VCVGLLLIALTKEGKCEEEERRDTEHWESTEHGDVFL